MPSPCRRRTMRDCNGRVKCVRRGLTVKKIPGKVWPKREAEASHTWLNTSPSPPPGGAATAPLPRCAQVPRGAHSQTFRVQDLPGAPGGTLGGLKPPRRVSAGACAEHSAVLVQKPLLRGRPGRSHAAILPSAVMRGGSPPNRPHTREARGRGPPRAQGFTTGLVSPELSITGADKPPGPVGDGLTSPGARTRPPSTRIAPWR